MAAPTAGEIMRQWFDAVWHRRDLTRVDAWIGPHTIIHAADESGGDIIGPEAYKAFLHRFLSGFPDIAFSMHVVVEQGAWASGRWTARLTHAGQGLGVAPTHRTVTITGMSMIRVEGGIVQEGWNEWDRLGLANALGLPPRA